MLVLTKDRRFCCTMYAPLLEAETQGIIHLWFYKYDPWWRSLVNDLNSYVFDNEQYLTRSRRAPAMRFHPIDLSNYIL